MVQGGCNQSQCYTRPCAGFTWYDPAKLPPAIDLFSFDHYVPYSCSNAESCSGVKPSVCASLRYPGMDHWNLSFVGACSQDPAAESRQVRQIYERLLYPKLSSSSQRLMVVPGLFGDADGNRSGSLAEQDAFMLAKLRGYRQWMEEDTRIAGLWLWHWGDEPLATKAQGFTYGANHLPRTVAYLQEMATVVGPTTE